MFQNLFRAMIISQIHCMHVIILLKSFEENLSTFISNLIFNKFNRANLVRIIFKCLAERLKADVIQFFWNYFNYIHKLIFSDFLTYFSKFFVIRGNIQFILSPIKFRWPEIFIYYAIFFSDDTFLFNNLEIRIIYRNIWRRVKEFRTILCAYSILSPNNLIIWADYWIFFKLLKILIVVVAIGNRYLINFCPYFIDWILFTWAKSLWLIL